MSRGPQSPGELERELAALAPDFRVLDRALALDGRPVAELVARLEGRLALVLVGEGAEPGLLERALAALAFARAHGAALAAHLNVELARPPCVLLVARRGFGREELERARLFASDALWLLERHELSTERGATRFLRRVDAPPSPPAPATPAPAAASSAPPPPWEELAPAVEPAGELDPELALLAEELAERLERVDPEIECEEEAGGLAWSLAGAPLCRLSAEDGRLLGRLAGSELPHRIASRADLDVFVDWVLSLHLAREEEPAEAPPLPRGALLTREEIEAFRD